MYIKAVSILGYLYILKKIKMPSKKSKRLAKIIMRGIESILYIIYGIIYIIADLYAIFILNIQYL